MAVAVAVDRVRMRKGQESRAAATAATAATLMHAESWAMGGEVIPVRGGGNRAMEGNGCGGLLWNGGGCERRRCERERGGVCCIGAAKPRASLVFCLTSKKSDNAYQLHALYLSSALSCSYLTVHFKRGIMACNMHSTTDSSSTPPPQHGAEPRYKKYIPK
jgi:hypothetical protein